MVNFNGKKSDTWSTQEGCYSNSYSGGSRDVGYQGEKFGNQQKRTDRAYSSQPCFYGSRKSASGGIVLQLIEETHRDLANHELEGIKLRDRLQKLELLFDQLEKTEE